MDNMNEANMSEAEKALALAGLRLCDGITTVANTRGISEEELEAIYAVGFANYGAGKYDEAEKVFHFLCMLSHTNGKYWLALGSVRQAKRNYEDALKAYAAAAMWDMHHPKPHYYSIECNLALGHLDEAESGVLTILDCCPAGIAENDEYRAKAQKLMEEIKAARSE